MQITTGQSFMLPLPRLPDEAIPLAMIWLPSSTFLMGSPRNEPNRIVEEEQQFEAIISHGFWIGKYPVTQAQWQVIMGNNPSHFQHINQNCPVENVTWYEAMEFCRRLNLSYGDCLPQDYSFSLPTEVQWEYGCRAGTQTTYNIGNSLKDLDRAAWHKDNSSGQTHPVGEKEPNAWGLCDMHGNTFEWCYDVPSSYPTFPTTDWVGEGNAGVRSIRSSSWATSLEATDHRCACRGAEIPDAKCPWFGFRVCLRQFLE